MVVPIPKHHSRADEGVLLILFQRRASCWPDRLGRMVRQAWHAHRGKQVLH